MTVMVKGFGCRQAYESLSCRNPRSAFSELWGFVYWSFRWAVDRRGVCQSQRAEMVFAGVIAEIFLVIGSAFARLEAIAIRTGAGPPVGRLCFEWTI